MDKQQEGMLNSTIVLCYISRPSQSTECNTEKFSQTKKKQGCNQEYIYYVLLP